MFLNTGLVGGGGGVSVQLPGISLGNRSLIPTVYSGIRFDDDGQIFIMDANGSWQSSDTWLLEGAASSYYLHRTIDTGTLSNDDGDARQLNTGDLDYWVSNSVGWFTLTATVTFEIADDGIKSNVYATRTYELIADKIGAGTPP